MRFLCSNIGSITSPNNIGVVLSNEGDIREGKSKGIAGKTVNKYVSMLCSAYIFSAVSRYDVKGKQHLKTLEKYGPSLTKEADFEFDRYRCEMFKAAQ